MASGDSFAANRTAFLALAGATAAVAILASCAAQRRRRRRRGLSVRVESAYTSRALRDAAAACGIPIQDDSVCEWCDFAAHAWDVFLDGRDTCRRVSCFYNRAGLVRKGMLAHYLQKRRRHAARAAVAGQPDGAQVADVLPEGLVVDLQDEDDLQQLEQQLRRAAPHEGEHPAWVAKASAANRAENLFVAHSIEDVMKTIHPAALGGGVVEWVVQRYVAPPFLLDGRKFHIRAHFVVTGCPFCGSATAWLHRRGHLALLAAEPYDAASRDRFVHLTNHCVQAAHPEYDEDRQTLALDEVDAVVGRRGTAAAALRRIEQALTEALAAAAAAPVGFAPLPQCFELFGADFALQDRGADEEPGVWLLEVNAGPDLSIFGSRLRKRCEELLRDTLRLAVEPYLDEVPAGPFLPAEKCRCRSPRAASSAGFGERCLWSVGPKTGSITEELDGFKRRVGIAGRWVRALHEGSGVVVRGPQGLAAA